MLTILTNSRDHLTNVLTSQLKGLSPVCTRMWCCKLAFVLNDILHCSQFIFFAEWIRRCLRKAPFCNNLLEQMYRGTYVWRQLNSHRSFYVWCWLLISTMNGTNSNWNGNIDKSLTNMQWQHYFRGQHCARYTEYHCNRCTSLSIMII